MTIPFPHMIDNPSVKGRVDKYVLISVDLKKIIEAWRISLFSFEWLTPDGVVRHVKDLPETEQGKYQTVLGVYQKGDALERPILGIGVMDNIEIGSRRDVLLTLYTQGVQALDVHVPKSAADYFKDYLSS